MKWAKKYPGVTSRALPVLGYGVLLALGAFGLTWLEFKAYSRDHAREITTLAIAGSFLILGLWMGRKLTPHPPRTEQPVATVPTQNHRFGLTRRETAVLELLVAGQSNKEMARTLGVSPNTIKTHLANLYAKLGVQRRTQAITTAQNIGLIN